MRHRIAAVGTNTAAAQAGYTPMASGHPRIAGLDGVPMTMPVALVTVFAPNPADGYSTVAYEDIEPIWGPMGEAIPARSPGSWGQLRAAGRP